MSDPLRLAAPASGAADLGNRNRLGFWSALFSPNRLFRNLIIRKCLIIDNLFDHVANVRSQEPINCDANKLRGIQDGASLYNRINISSDRPREFLPTCFIFGSANDRADPQKPFLAWNAHNVAARFADRMTTLAQSGEFGLQSADFRVVNDVALV
jgi:hypothetical protein